MISINPYSTITFPNIEVTVKGPPRQWNLKDPPGNGLIVRIQSQLLVCLVFRRSRQLLDRIHVTSTPLFPGSKDPQAAGDSP